MSFKNMNICIRNNETQYRKYFWSDDFEEMDFTVGVTWDYQYNYDKDYEYKEYNPNISTHLTKKMQIDQDTDNLVIKLSKFPLEFIPENNTKRLKIFIEISFNIY